MSEDKNIINKIIPEKIPSKEKLQFILPLFRGEDRFHTHITTDENIEILLDRLDSLDSYHMDKYDGSRLTEVAVRGSVKNEKCILESKENNLKIIQNYSNSHPELIQTPLQTEKSTVHSSSGSYSFDTNFSLIAIEKPEKPIDNYKPHTEYLDDSKLSKRIGFHHYVLFGEPQYNDMFIRNSIENIDDIKEYIRASNSIEPEISQEAEETIRYVYYSDSKWNNTFGKRINIRIVSKAYARLKQQDEVTPEMISEIGAIYDEHIEKDRGFDVDLTNNTSQDDIEKNLLKVIEEFEDEGERGAPEDIIIDIMTQELYDYDEEHVEHRLNKLCREGKKILRPIKGEYIIM